MQNCPSYLTPKALHFPQVPSSYPTRQLPITPVSLIAASSPAIPLQPASNIHPDPSPSSRTPGSRLLLCKQGVQPGTPSQAPISLNWGRAEARERGPGGARGLGLGQPGWEGNPCGKEEVTRSPTGRETPKSESAAESGGSAARAHAGPRPTSWAPVLRAPLPGPLTRAARASAAAGSRADGAELSRSGSPHLSDSGTGGARGLPSGGGTAPASPPRDPRRVRPAPAVLRAALGRGVLLCSAGLRAGSVRRSGAVSRSVRLSRAVGPGVPCCRPVGARRGAPHLPLARPPGAFRPQRRRASRWGPAAVPSSAGSEPHRIPPGRRV